ncbi:MAG: glycosyltransferase [Clostridia bacterium]|nr:glycosyltransferase [Clostridia bacterium]
MLEMKTTLKTESFTVEIDYSKEGELLAVLSDALPEGTMTAWAVLKSGADEPVFKTEFSGERGFSCALTEEGSYIVRLSLRDEAGERSEDSGPFDIAAEPKEKQWLDDYEEAIAAIPDSSGTRYYKRLGCRVGIICDEFFYESICAAADFVYITPDNWEQVVDRNNIDVFLFVTAWRGLHEEWRGLAVLRAIIDRKYNALRDTVQKIIARCREQGIPTVFYSKEDPPNYEMFLDFAKASDYVFTTAAECVPYYKKDCGHDRVSSVMFGINPNFHNPIGCYKKDKEKTVLFSGSWMKKYPKRCSEISVIFDGILASDYSLHIVDRNYGVEQYNYPEPYNSLSSAAVEHAKLGKLHKLFDWAVNINSVTGSETMFANRAFELQASGVLLLSNYSVGVNRVHPTVFIVNDAAEVSRILGALTGEELYERQIAGIRSVMTGHTCYDRIAELLSPAGIDASQPVRRALVIAADDSDSAKECFERQTYKDKTFITREVLTEEILNEYDIVAWFDGNSQYDEYYLEDMINAFKYTACDYVTKDAYFKDGALTEGAEHTYTGEMKSPYRTVFWREAYDAAFLMTPPEPQALENGYAADRFSYREGTTEAPAAGGALISVVIPVTNNGARLAAKSVASLKRSSIFSDLEILLIDDGAADDATVKAESFIMRKYPNISLYKLSDGAEASPENMIRAGEALAGAPYIAFLNAGDEAVCDGYAAMYEKAAETNADVVIGRGFEFDREPVLCGEGLDVSAERAERVKAAGFPEASLQSMLIKREFLNEAFPEGIQLRGSLSKRDTLPFWRLLEATDAAETVDMPVYAAYTYEGKVKTAAFEKALSDSREDIYWLEDRGLSDAYGEGAMGERIKRDFFNRLQDAESPGECIPVLSRAASMYEPYNGGKDLVVHVIDYLNKKERFEEAAELIGEAYPKSRKRPMPTIAELSKGVKKKSVFKIDVTKEGSTITLINMSKDSDGDTFAWVVLASVNNTYEKIFGSKYTSDRIFSYDFSKFGPGDYKVRAFKVAGDGKKSSEDALFLKVGGDRTVAITEG